MGDKTKGLSDLCNGTLLFFPPLECFGFHRIFSVYEKWDWGLPASESNHLVFLSRCLFCQIRIYKSRTGICILYTCWRWLLCFLKAKVMTDKKIPQVLHCWVFVCSLELKMRLLHMEHWSDLRVHLKYKVSSPTVVFCDDCWMSQVCMSGRVVFH